MKRKKRLNKNEFKMKRDKNEINHLLIKKFYSFLIFVLANATSTNSTYIFGTIVLHSCSWVCLCNARSFHLFFSLTNESNAVLLVCWPCFVLLFDPHRNIFVAKKFAVIQSHLPLLWISLLLFGRCIVTPFNKHLSNVERIKCQI